MVEILSEHLLGGHVAGRAEREAGAGELGVAGGAAREPEVGEHGAAVVVDEHVVGLEVAVDDAGVVRVLEPESHLSQVAPRGRAVERTLVEDVPQGSALDERHGDEDDVGGHDEVVDGEDVGVVEPGEGLRLELEALEERAVVLQRRGQRLERDLAAERLLDGAVDDGHAAGAEALFDVVVGDSLA